MADNEPTSQEDTGDIASFIEHEKLREWINEIVVADDDTAIGTLDMAETKTALSAIRILSTQRDAAATEALKLMNSCYDEQNKSKRLGEEVERSTKRAKTLIALDKELGDYNTSAKLISKDELNTKPVILEEEIEGVHAPVARVFKKLFTVLPDVPPVDLYEKQRLRPSYVLVFLKELAELKIDDAAFKKLDVGRMLNAVHELSASVSARDADEAKMFADRAIISLRQAVALSSD